MNIRQVAVSHLANFGSSNLTTLTNIGCGAIVVPAPPIQVDPNAPLIVAHRSVPAEPLGATVTMVSQTSGEFFFLIKLVQCECLI